MKKSIIAFILVISGLTVFSSKLMAQKKNPSLNHIALYVVDLKKSTAFYQNVIQIDTIPEPFHDGKHAWFSIGSHSQLHIIEGAKEVIQREKNTHLCFSVESIEQMIERLKKLKIPFSNVQGEMNTFTVRVDGVKQIYFQDPDNFWIEINNDKY